MAKVKGFILHVKLADNEWGSELMQQRARHELTAGVYAHLPNLAVHVDEHAGWWLTWALVDGEMVCVGTANDMAVMDGKAKEFWARTRDWERIFPWLDRPSLSIVA